MLSAIALRADRRVGYALRGWLAGEPHDEVVFLNRFTAYFRTSPFCWLAGSVGVETQTHALHRRGHGQRPHADKYGSDLAVTVRINFRDAAPTTIVKTAFIQVKRVHPKKRIEIDGPQLDDARSIPGVWDRYFFAALTEDVPAAFVIKASDVLPGTWKAGDSLSASVGLGWSRSFDWIDKWLRCDVGPPSRGPLPVESLLQSLLPLTTPRYDWIPGPDEPDDRHAVDPLGELPPDLLPAKAWVVAMIELSDGNRL